MNNLTLDDIHKIREEHAILSRDMSFEEYKKALSQDIQPLLDLLKSMKIEQKKTKPYSVDVKSDIAAEPVMKYKTKNHYQ